MQAFVLILQHNQNALNKKLHVLFIVLLLCNCLLAQNKRGSLVNISGTVYDISARTPIEAVAVMSTSGRGAITDSLGRYFITVYATDSIWFSMLNKTTLKFPVDTIKNTDAFDIMIHVKAAELPEVKIRNRSYKLDSLQNRQDYAKYFAFKKPNPFRVATDNSFNPGGLTVGFDLNEIVNMFRFKYVKRMGMLQKRLLEDEQDKYIDHRYSKTLARKITKLQPPELDSFMNKYRPSYELITGFNDLELADYIDKCYQVYQMDKKHMRGNLRKNDNE